MMTIRTLVLSGGGGRGAFHAGVYKYLMEASKPGLDGEHQGAWVPDIVIGTSIGAVNGAAIVQGVSPEALERFWLSLREHDIQGLPPGMGWLARRVANAILKPTIGAHLPHLSEGQAMSQSAEDSWPPLPVMPHWMSSRLIGRWSNLLDTGPLRRTLVERLHLDETKINSSERTLLISATNVRTGEAVIFSNKPVINPKTDETFDYCRPNITIKRIIASCSIPLIYPWTHDDDGELYWDGAVVANTPLGPAFDAVRNRPSDEPMEAVVVMMTPWWESDEPAPNHPDMPGDFGEAMTWTLDWALLASFRRDLKLAKTFNRMGEMERTAQGHTGYRYCDPIIVAPENFLPVARIIDYDEPASRDLIQQGYAAAQRAFNHHFGAEL